MDLELAAVARACIHLADGKAAPEPSPRLAFERLPEFRQSGIAGGGRGLCEGPAEKAF
jgi:hypothetical protein